jgi:hypothetical protein
MFGLEYSRSQFINKKELEGKKKDFTVVYDGSADNEIND